jgi:two-component system, NtrC family, sensor kinase
VIDLTDYPRVHGPAGENPAAPLRPSGRPGPDVKRMAACLAHNVNNSLTGIVGHLELALRDSAPTSPQSEHLRHGLNGAYRIAEVFRRLIGFAYRSAAPPVCERLSLRWAASLAAGRVEPAAARQGVSVVLEGAEPACVLGNARMIQAILDQLMLNALEAMSQGGRLTLRLEGEEGGLRFAVADTGLGLSAEARAHLFEPFFSTKASGHLGLGLILCREMAELQGGSLTVASMPGKGAVATLWFPVPGAEANARVAEPQTAYAQPHICLEVS